MRGLSILFFFLVLFLQQIGGYTPLQSGFATLPVTVVMFVLSRRFGALADRFGPRLFMGAGPLLAAAGLLLFQRVGVKADYLAEVLPPLLVFALGLSMTVAPLTAAVLAGSEHEAGIASGVNNAVARVAGLLGTAAVGAVISSVFAASMDSHLVGVVLTGRARTALDAVKRLALGRPDVGGLPPGAGTHVARGRRSRRRAQLSRRYGDRRRTGGARWGSGRRWHPQPARVLEPVGRAGGRQGACVGLRRWAAGGRGGEGLLVSPWLRCAEQRKAQ